MNDSYILELIGALAQSKTKKQVNADLKQIEKVINMLRITGTFAKGDTKKELNAYIKSLQSQLSHIKLTAKIDSKNLKREVDKALNGISFKDIDALNIDENKTKLKIRKIIADAKAYAEKSPITVNIESKKNKLNNDLTAYLNRNTKISESSVLLKEAERVRELINAIGDKKTLREATDAFQLYKSEVSATGFNTKSTTDKIKDMLGHVSKISSAFGVASIAVNNFVKSLKTLKYNDTILTEISKTSEMTKQQLRGLGDEAFKTASKYGQLSSNYLIAVQEMARSGYEETSKELGKLSLLAQSAGDMTAESANNYLLATDAAYKYGGSIEKLNAALDGANYISNKNSATLTDIADATRVSASFAANAGVAIDELTAAEATMLAVTKRGGSEIGRAFRSIVLNLQQVSGEFDGEIIDEEQLKKVEARCHSLGVELEYMKDGIATLRNPIEVLKELAEVYNSLPDNSAEKQGLISDLGGKYHANALSSLLSRWDLYEKMLGEFSQGTGSALEEAEKTADSWEGRLNSLSNTFTSFVNVITNKDTILNGISFFDRLIQGAETLIDIVGEVPVVLTAVNSSLVAMNKDYGITQLVNKDTGKFDIQGNLLGIDFSTIKEQKKHFKEAEDAITIWNNKLKNGKNDLEAFNYAVVQNNAQLKDYLSTTSKDAPASLSGYKAHLNAAGVSTDALRLKTILLNSAISMGIGFAIQAVVQGITYLIQREEELRQATQESANAYKESASSIEDYTKRYQELRQALIAAKGNEEETYNIKKQLLDLQTELNDKFGEEYGKINLVTDAYRDQTDAIKDYNKEAAKEFLNTDRKGIKQAEKEMTKERHYNLSPVNISAFTKEGEALKEIAGQFKDQGVSLLDELGDGTYNQFSVHLNTDAQSAYDTINEFENALRDKAEELGNEHLFDDILDISSISVNDAKGVLDDWGDIYQESLMAEIAKDDSLTSQMNEAAKAVQEYNEAVLNSEDPFNDENVQKARENLLSLKAEMQNDDGSWNSKWQKYASILDDVFNQADMRLLNFDNAIRNDTSVQELAEKLRGIDDIALQGISDSMDEDNKFQGVAAQLLKITESGDEVKDAFSELIEFADEYDVSADELISTLTRLGYVQSSVASSAEETANAFAGWDALNEQIDAIQTSYKAIQAAQEEYNKYGYVSLDTLQALISLDSQYLACLIDENGQLQLNSLTYQNLVQAKLAEAEATAVAQAVEELSNLQKQADVQNSAACVNANAILAESLATLSGNYSAVASSAAAAAKAEALASAMADARERGVDEADINKVMSNLNAELALIQNTTISAGKSFGGLNNAVNGFSNAQKGAKKATDDATEALKKQKEALEEQKDALEDSKKELEELYDAVQWFYDKQIDGIDDFIDKLNDANDVLEKQKDKYNNILSVIDNVYGDEIDAIQAKIDAMDKANDAAERELALENAKQALEEARRRRAIKLYTKNRGFIYTVDEDAIKEAEDELANATQDKVKAELQEQIDLLEQWRDKWAEIPDAFEKAMNEIAAIEKFGPDYKNFILSSDDDDINSFKNDYTGVQSNIADNDAKIDYYEQQKKKIEELKDLWEDAKNAYRDSQYEAKLSAFFGSDYEYQLLNNSSSWRIKFADEYADVCRQIEEIEKQIKTLSSETTSSLTNEAEQATNALGRTSGAIKGLKDTAGSGNTLSYYIWTDKDESDLGNAQTNLMALDRQIAQGNTTLIDSRNALSDFIDKYKDLKETRTSVDEVNSSLETLRNYSGDYTDYFSLVMDNVSSMLNDSSKYTDHIVEYTRAAAENMNQLNEAIQTSKESNAEIKENADTAVEDTNAIISTALENVSKLNESLTSIGTAKTELETLVNEEVTNADALVTTSEEKLTNVKTLITELLNAVTSLETSFNDLNFQLSQLDTVTFENVISAIGFGGGEEEASGLMGSISNVLSLLNGEEGLIAQLNILNETPLDILTAEFNGEEGLTIAITDVITMISGEEGLIVQINRITETIGNIESVKSSFSNLESQVTACVNKVAELAKEINSLEDKTITITTVYQTVGSPTGGGGKATGTVFTGRGYASGTVDTGKSYAKGNNIGLPYDQKAMVSELGPEMLVRDGRYILIKEPQLMDLKKGDIIFNHEQTKAILERGKSSNISRLENLGEKKFPELPDNLIPFENPWDALNALNIEGNSFASGTITEEMYNRLMRNIENTHNGPDYSGYLKALNNVAIQKQKESTVIYIDKVEMPNIKDRDDARKLISELENLSNTALQRAYRRDFR